MGLKNHGKRRRWDQYEDEKLINTYLDKLQESDTIEEAHRKTSEIIGRTTNAVKTRLSLLRYFGADIPKRYRQTPEHEFAFYRGEEIVGMGTYKELSELTGLKVETLRFYATISHKTRMSQDSPVLVRIDEDEEDDPIESR